MNSYPKHVGDFIRDTVGLSMLEDGAYNRLLDQYYAREGPLPLDERELYRLCRASSGPERKAVQYVLGTFFERRDDGWHQRRADRELAAYQDKADSARRSAAARWHSEPHADAMRTHYEGNASQEPIAKTKEKKKQGSAPSRASPQGTRLAIDWELPSAWSDWAVQERGWSREQVENVAFKFREYWSQKSGKTACKLDWLQTWRNWVWGERMLPARPNGSREPSLAEKRAANVAAMTGQTRHVIDITSARVDSTPVLAHDDGLRKPLLADVGRRSAGGGDSGLG